MPNLNTSNRKKERESPLWLGSLVKYEAGGERQRIFTFNTAEQYAPSSSIEEGKRVNSIFTKKQRKEDRSWTMSEYLTSIDNPHFLNSLITSDRKEERYHEVEEG